jgi:hypothetical protein
VTYYSRRLAGTLTWLIGAPARDTSVCSDDVWVVDSTPVECARAREPARRWQLAGRAEDGYCAGHSRSFWDLRRHLVAPLHGLPVADALTGANAEERQVLLDLLRADPTLAAARPGQTLIADKNYHGRDSQTSLADAGIELLRRERKGEPKRSGGGFFKPLRQTIESIVDTLKGQLDLERHGGHTRTGVRVRVPQRILPLTAAVCTTTTPANRSGGHCQLRPLTPWNRSSSCGGGRATRRAVVGAVMPRDGWRPTPARRPTPPLPGRAVGGSRRNA